ncbi:hypothetical protein BGW39_005745 [Mortierella sp. 14UC]|nr:hypothetical protein BGW39_005745 [Mortierella sp. 14UC]
MPSDTLKMVTTDLQRPLEEEAEKLGLCIVSEGMNVDNLLPVRIHFIEDSIETGGDISSIVYGLSFSFQS